MSDIKLWENPLFSIEERLVHANAEIFARGQTIAALKEQNALLTVQVQEGWKLVPVDLPQNHPMRSKLIEYAERIAAGQSILYADMWADIVANAPALPQQVKSEDARECRWTPMDEQNRVCLFDHTKIMQCAERQK